MVRSQLVQKMRKKNTNRTLSPNVFVSNRSIFHLLVCFYLILKSRVTHSQKENIGARLGQGISRC